MNAERLRSYLDRVLDAPAALNLDRAASELQNALSTFATAANGQNRNAVNSALSELHDVGQQLSSQLSDPDSLEAIDGLDARAITLDFAPEIEGLTAGQMGTPSVASSRIAEIRSERTSRLHALSSMRGQLERMGIQPDAPEPGTANLDVEIPPTLFGGELRGLAEELSDLDSILVTFSRVAVNDARSPALVGLSTSVPHIILSLDPHTIIHLYAALKVVIDLTKTFGALRTVLRGAIKYLGSEPHAEAEKKINEEIDQIIAREVASKMDDLKKDRTDADANELAAALRVAYRSLLPKVEAGVRFKVSVNVTAEISEDTRKILIEAKSEADEVAFPTLPSPVSGRIADGREGTSAQDAN